MDFDLCTSDLGDGCGGSFTFKTSPGLCAKCQKLAMLQPDSLEYITWSVSLVLLLEPFLLCLQKMRQCDHCGLAWKNLTSNTCGRCAGQLAKTITGSGPNPRKSFKIDQSVH